MTHRFKIFLILLSLGGLLYCSFVYISHILPGKINNLLSEKVASELLSIEKSSVGKCRISFVSPSIKINDISISAQWKTREAFLPPRDISLEFNAEIGVIDFLKKEFRLKIQNLSFIGGNLRDSDRDSSSNRLERIDQAAFEIDFNTEKWSLRSLKKGLYKKIFEIFKSYLNHTPIKKMQGEGDLTLLLDELPIQLSFYTEEEKGDVYFRGNLKDLRVIAERMEAKFTEEDIRIIGNNLLLAPKLWQIKTQSLEEAAILSEGREGVSKDDLRHIFWAYYLAEEFGEAFAEEVTLAHEIGDEGNTEEEHLKDICHNRLGIEYFNKGFDMEKWIKDFLQNPEICLGDSDGDNSVS